MLTGRRAAEGDGVGADQVNELVLDPPDAPGGDQVTRLGDHPCQKCGEEHRQEVEALRAEVKEWKQRAEEYEIKAALHERHLDEVKESRMEFRNEVTLLEAELVQVKAELERAKKQPWRKKG